MDRRSFVARGTFFTVAAAVLAACGRGSGGDDAGTYLFAQGVASGDPKDTSVVFWTRCVRADGSPDDVPLTLQVSANGSFEGALVASVPLVATATWDHTVRAKVTGLASGTAYTYRFVAGADASPTGATRTAPLPSSQPAQLRFAWLTCQDWSVNHWAAMDLLAADSFDCLIQVGDYVYETVPATLVPRAAEPAHGRIVLPDGTSLPDGTRYATTLADYRTLYRTYRGDARLRTLHARWPMIAIWDDHEFSDDCWQDHQAYTNANLQQTARRRAANQAWVEYMPVDFGDVSFDAASPAYDNLRLYRDFRFGSLAHLVMTDERLYRDRHVVDAAQYAVAHGDDPVGGNDFVGTRVFVSQSLLAQSEAQRTAALGRPPSLLGPGQTDWFLQTLQASPATWKLWGNPLVLNRLWLDLRNLAPSPYDDVFVLDADAWDGYPTYKSALLAALRQRGVRNLVALTGDLHAFQCGVVRAQPDPATGVPVLVDFVCAGISSTSLFGALKAMAGDSPLADLVVTPSVLDGAVRRDNPDLLHVDHDAQGYATVTLTPTSLTVDFVKVKPLNADGTAPGSPLAGRTRFTLASGSLAPVVQQNV